MSSPKPSTYISHENKSQKSARNFRFTFLVPCLASPFSGSGPCGVGETEMTQRCFHRVSGQPQAPCRSRDSTSWALADLPRHTAESEEHARRPATPTSSTRIVPSQGPPTQRHGEDPGFTSTSDYAKNKPLPVYRGIFKG